MAARFGGLNRAGNREREQLARWACAGALAAALLGLLVPASAFAGEVSYEPRHSGFGPLPETAVYRELGTSLYTAAPDLMPVAEPNDVLVEVQGRDRVTFTERRGLEGLGLVVPAAGAAAINALQQCTFALRRATCTPAGPPGFDQVRVALGWLDGPALENRAIIHSTGDAPLVLVVGGEGPDMVRSIGPGRLSFHGRSGDDRVIGGEGDDHLRGGGGNNVMVAGGGENVIEGGPGDDRIHAANGNRDRIVCGAGHDIVFADPFDDIAPDCDDVRIVDPG